MINEICDLFAQRGPKITKKLPVSWGGESDSPTYLDFLRRLALEGLEILRSGDSMIKAESIPFSEIDCGTLLNSWRNIKDLIDSDNAVINGQTKSLPAALYNVHKFYALRVGSSLERAQQHDGELGHFQDVTKPSLLNQGDMGHAILYGGLDDTRPDHLQKGTVSLADFANWKNEQEEVLGYYNGASEMNPAMLGVGGKAPKEIELEDSISACEQDEGRHKETAHEILTLINKLNKIGLVAQVSRTQEDNRLEI